MEEKKLDKIIELLEKQQDIINQQEKLIELLKTRQYIQQPIIQYLPFNPNIHYHGSIPCYNNPCIWC